MRAWTLRQRECSSLVSAQPRLQHIAIQRQDRSRIIAAWAGSQPPSPRAVFRQANPTCPGRDPRCPRTRRHDRCQIEGGGSAPEIPEVCSPQENRPTVAYHPRGILRIKVNFTAISRRCSRQRNCEGTLSSRRELPGRSFRVARDPCLRCPGSLGTSAGIMNL